MEIFFSPLTFPRHKQMNSVLILRFGINDTSLQSDERKDVKAKNGDRYHE